MVSFIFAWAFQVALVVKNHLPMQETRAMGFDPWVWKVPWRKKWQSIPVSLPGKLHRQRRLVGYSPKGCKMSDTTEWLKHYIHLSRICKFKEIENTLDIIRS